MTDTQRTISPVDGTVVVERKYAASQEINAVLDAAVWAQKSWKATTLAERVEICERFAQYLLDHQEEIALDITRQMGRPISQTPGEVRGCVDRARTMIELAPEGLADVRPKARDGFDRFIRRAPVGVVYVIAPWNYPLLTAINTIVPAILAGNAVVLKHAAQTPLCGDAFAKAFESAGLPKNVFQALVVDHADAERIVGDRRINHVAFTGSVRTGHLVQKAAAERFISVGLELGGKDPAYVRADADIAFAAENLVDGAFFNSGQSCCGIERIYVHASVYDKFVERAVEIAKEYRLGDPMDPSTNLGPVVSASAAKFIRGQVDDAIAKGAKDLVPITTFEKDRPESAFVSPRILSNVDHGMRLMTEETFGPVVGIMRVGTDEEAVNLMNDSDFGLTASIWTSDVAAAEDLADKIETGTVFLNRCDHLDPSLAWTGVKDSGRGVTLSVLGFDHLTRPKSHHFRLNTE
ncbi:MULTISPECIES: aldehyde dehydrogenase family protein [unclassified Rhizobium]|jgi:acyl-CoA reductase-like NAD-dependent aldehyde dehydrogenase|uniref:aldehyde dehydrogenase family protein n=1 Tax=Hyphomicrobiales TaxID=356 RepID=UPI000647B482|nr:aldehyde dehydrogenase family protein [Rhizobium sp. WW_1]RKD74067.1 acyl-CoA reductase-like NAD-dependent aldehyde dehydrogenase [Rhizobium sp. WW_1]